MQLKSAQEALMAYLATLTAIVLLTGMAVVAVMSADDADGERLGIGLGFIAAAVTGLVGVIGTFRPKGLARASSAQERE